MSAGRVRDIRAAEISALRRENRELRRRLETLHITAADNEEILRAAQDAALLLLKKPSPSAADLAAFLKRRLRAAHCEIFIFKGGAKDAALARALKKKIIGAPPPPLRAVLKKPYAFCCALPMRGGKEKSGALVFADNRKDFFGGEDSAFLAHIAAIAAAAFLGEKTPRPAKRAKNNPPAAKR